MPKNPESSATNAPEKEAQKKFDLGVNPDNYQIFRKQGEDGRTLGLNETLCRHITATAETIAVLDGDDKNYPKADHVIYLDKSARPVSWLVGAFWDIFSDNKKRPTNSFLAIDRREWFERTGTELDGYEYTDGHLATFSDFKKENVTREEIAAIRALYIPGGVQSEDVDEIMNTPTGLEGKNITIVDEVSRSGSTAAIAQWLVSQAIPEAASVKSYTYWSSNIKILDNGEAQMKSAPVWYDHSSSLGRGIGDVNPAFFEERHKKYHTPYTLAQKIGAFVLGSFIDLGNEGGGSNPSRRLAKEILQMRDDFLKGHILMASPAMGHTRIFDKWMDWLESYGLYDPKNPSSNLYIKLRQQIEKEPPSY